MSLPHSAPREASFTGTAAAAGAEHLPQPPGGRRLGLAALAVLLIVGSAAVAGLLALRLDDRVPVIVARSDIAAGQQITRSDLAFARVASDGVALIPADQVDQVVGRYASQEIPSGRLIDSAMVSGSGLLRSGFAAVGVKLSAGHAPASSLRTGDRVDVVRATDGKAEVLASSATVGTVSKSANSAFGSGRGETSVSVIVERKVAAEVAAAAAADNIVLVLVERGAAVGG